jgi:predicted nucleic acid-binding protein
VTVVADTGAIVALMDADEQHHAVMKELYRADPSRWILPSAILAEVDYLVAHHLGSGAQRAWLSDLAGGAFRIEWSRDDDLTAAYRIHERYRALGIGLVDALVAATAERLRADAIATLDLRHFGAMSFHRKLHLFPRDL